tara:strand:+ start:398 stop:1054 length:657 start_codon:yes stop_codon:yes gene_type:complete
MVDFGCGVGTWLKTGKELGVNEILGLEGNWLDVKHLVIPEINFIHKNLTSNINLAKRFDLAISLEVAEHIEEKFSDIFIDNLTQASEIILFSAAVPGQRGSGHVNEQWPEYWIEKFKSRGFLPLDVIRPYVWKDSTIKSWYKQNTLLFIHTNRLDELPQLTPFIDEKRTMWSVIHPDTFLRQIEISHPKYSNLSKVLRSLPIVILNSVKSAIKKTLKS